MATSTNYTGRNVDLNIFQNTPAEGAGESLVELVFGGDGGEVVTGIHKLCQSFTVLFLTEISSIPLHTALGTNFVTAVRMGRLRDEGDVRSEFQESAERVKQTLDLEIDTYNLPEDEQIESVVLQNFEINQAASQLKIYVRITTVAGNSRVLYLPVPIAIQ